MRSSIQNSRLSLVNNHVYMFTMNGYAIWYIVIYFSTSSDSLYLTEVKVSFAIKFYIYIH